MKLSLTLVTFFLLLASCFTSSGQSSPCRETDLGGISFKAKSPKLTMNAKKQLDRVAEVLKANNDSCQLVATASYADLCDRCGVLAWDRIQAVFHYLAKKGVVKRKMISSSRLDGNTNFINLTLAQITEGEQRHPNYRRN